MRRPRRSRRRPIGSATRRPAPGPRPHAAHDEGPFTLPPACREGLEALRADYLRQAPDPLLRARVACAVRRRPRSQPQGGAAGPWRRWGGAVPLTALLALVAGWILGTPAGPAPRRDTPPALVRAGLEFSPLGPSLTPPATRAPAAPSLTLGRLVASAAALPTPPPAVEAFWLACTLDEDPDVRATAHALLHALGAPAAGVPSR